MPMMTVKQFSTALLCGASMTFLSACHFFAVDETEPRMTTAGDDAFRGVSHAALAQPRDDEDVGTIDQPAMGEETNPIDPGTGSGTSIDGRDTTIPEVTIDPTLGHMTAESGDDFDITSVQDFEMRVLLDKARREMLEGNLEAADKTLTFALERDAESTPAQTMRDEVRLLLSRVSVGATTPVEQEFLSSIEEYTSEAQKLFDDAQRYEEEERWSDAKSAYGRLLELIRFAPYKAELKDKFEARAKAGKRAAEINERKARVEQEAQQREEALRLAALEKMSEEQRRKEQIVQMWRQAIYDVELKKYLRAEELLEQILEMDPNFRKAEELQADIASLRLNNIRREAFEQRMLGYRRAMLEIREALVPQTEIVVYPHGELARRIRDRVNRLPDAVPVDRDRAAIEAKLESKIIPFNFPDATPLSDVIQYIRDEVGVNILLGEDVGDLEVRLTLDNVPVSSALSLMLRQHKDLKRVYSDGVLMVAMEDKDVDPNTLVTRVHDIRDITYQLQDFQGPEINLKAQDTTSSSQPPQPPDLSGDRNVDADTVIEFIQSGVAPETWDNPATLYLYGGQLVVMNTVEVQAEVREFLNNMRRTAGLMVAMEARFISVNDNFLADFGIDFRGLGGPSSVPNQANLLLEDVRSLAEDNAGGAFDNGNLGVSADNPSAGIFFNNDSPDGPVNFNRDIRGRFENIYDNALGNSLTEVGGLAVQVAIFRNLTQINAVIRAVEKKQKAQTLIAPRLSAFNTERVNVAIINQIPFVSDFTVNAGVGVAIADPVIDTAIDGIVLEVQPTISNDRRFITIEVIPTISELLLPIPTFSTSLGANTTPVTIQLPQVRFQQASTTVRVPDGGAVVIGGLKNARRIDKEVGTPILSELPLIGVLFRRKGRNSESSHIVIVISAKVIDLNDEELRQPGWH